MHQKVSHYLGIVVQGSLKTPTLLNLRGCILTKGLFGLKGRGGEGFGESGLEEKNKKFSNISK